MKKPNQLRKQLSIAILLSLTLGLAPFIPEPHIWGKLKWLWGGGIGMQTVDYLDLVLHGSPWLFLILTAIRIAISRVNRSLSN